MKIEIEKIRYDKIGKTREAKTKEKHGKGNKK